MGQLAVSTTPGFRPRHTRVRPLLLFPLPVGWSLQQFAYTKIGVEAKKMEFIFKSHQCVSCETLVLNVEVSSKRTYHLYVGFNRKCTAVELVTYNKP